LESGGLGECVSVLVSFAYRRVGSSILATFTLRGRWERIAKSGEQAPSPSLASLLNSSCETHSCPLYCTGCAMSAALGVPPSLSLTNTWPSFWISRTAPNPSCNSTLELAKTDSGMRPSPALRFDDPPWLQDLGNKIFRLRALSVFWRVYRRIPSCASFPVTSRVAGVSAPEPRLFS
jgi:hypothetical protein